MTQTKRQNVRRTAAIACLLAGSVAAFPAAAQMRASIGGRADAASSASFDVYLPMRDSAGLETLLNEQQRPGSPLYHHWLTPTQFASRFGASPDAMAKVITRLRSAGLAAQVSGSHSVHAAGSVAAVESVLGTQLATGYFPNGKHRLVAKSPPALPAELTASGAVVANFAGVTHMHRHAVRSGWTLTENRTSRTGSYWFDDLKQAYSYPSVAVANGTGANIGILMSGDFLPSDMTLYFGHENLPVPKFSTVPIFGGAAFDPNGDSVESELDLQQSGGMAPGANITLYNIPDLTDAAILAGLSTIVETNAVDIVSMSFGGPEVGYTAAYNNGVDFTAVLTVVDGMFKQGNAQGITFVASSGDGGALPIPQPACFASGAVDGCGVFVRTAENPATSPHVTAVGGSNLVTTHFVTNLNSNYVSEAAAFDPVASDIFYSTPATGAIWGSGGGLSIVFAQPSYQKGISTISRNKRMVPDVALHMGGCPGGAVLPCGPSRSADVAAINGSFVGLIGTSAAAPDFAGLLALKVQLTGGRLGNENVNLYTLAHLQALGTKPLVFHTGIKGNNGYGAVPGYNLVLGNGTLFANAYLGVSNLPVAGTPQTPSNP